MGPSKNKASGVPLHCVKDIATGRICSGILLHKFHQCTHRLCTESRGFHLSLCWTWQRRNQNLLLCSRVYNDLPLERMRKGTCNGGKITTTVDVTSWHHSWLAQLVWLPQQGSTACQQLHPKQPEIRITEGVLSSIGLSIHEGHPQRLSPGKTAFKGKWSGNLEPPPWWQPDHKTSSLEIVIWSLVIDTLSTSNPEVFFFFLDIWWMMPFSAVVNGFVFRKEVS